MKLSLHKCRNMDRVLILLFFILETTESSWFSQQII